MELKDNLKNLRIKNNLTQEELANKLYVSRQSISKWEQGQSEPNIETLKLLCNIYNCKIEEIVGTSIEKSKYSYSNLFLSNILFLFLNIILSFIFLRYINTIPLNIDIEGNVLAFGNKFYILILPCISLFIFVICSAFYNKLIRHDLYKSNKATQITQLISNILIFVGIIATGITCSAQTVATFKTIIMQIISASALILGIATLIKANCPNQFFGFRTIFTLSNAKAWKIVNTLQGLLIIISSIVIIILNLFVIAEFNIYFVFIYVFVTLLTLICERFIYFKIKKNN